MKVAVLHGDVSPEALEDEQDVLREVEAVSQALFDLGYEPVAVPVSLDLQRAVETLQALNPAFGFNLVESVAGRGQFISVGPTIFEYLGLPYTGASPAAMFTTSNKLSAKKLLQAFGIPTPPWIPIDQERGNNLPFPGPYILKSVWEHASIGLDDQAVLTDWSLLQPALARQRRYWGGQWFVEQYIEGREFNLALLAGPQGPEVLPPAEIEFVNYPADKYKIVNYRAKWEEQSFEYQHTHRRFDFPATDNSLLQHLMLLAKTCWNIFELRGYARVDFRVDQRGQPWVLEVNANPCIAPDSGFVAATERAGFDFHQVVQRILEDMRPSISELKGVRYPEHKW